MGSFATPDIEAILASLTLEEKASLLAGKNFWETVDIPSKGVPSVKVSDGPNGARGAAFTGGPTAACFPASVLLASTWDLELAKGIGYALADETRSKGARALLAPTVCPHRHPLGGRNFESFSEDPLLAGKMAAGYISALQEKGVAATIKHFAANEQETNRFTVNETVSERALREIYLKPFEIAIKEANPWAVMTSYNLVNGTHADMNEFLLRKVLRGQWGWEGLVMSDWGGTNSTVESIQAGLDLEMPGPTKWRGPNTITAAVKLGKISMNVIDERVRNVLRFLVKLNCFADPAIPPEQAINLPEHQELIRKVGGQGIVLLKNQDSILPLRREAVKGKKIALIGVAKEGLIHGGGSAQVNAHYRITPEQGLKNALGDDVEFVYAKGAHTFRQLPLLVNDVAAISGEKGWTMDFFEGADMSGTPGSTSVSEDPRYLPIFVKETWGGIKVSGKYTPSISGAHYLALSGLGPSQLFIDGVQVFEQTENCPDSMAFLLGGVKETKIQHNFEAGKTYLIQVKTVAPEKDGGFALLDGCIGYRLGFMTEAEHNQDLLSEAVEVAKGADVALVFTGHTPDWETEGQDQLSFHLPSEGSQDRLVTAVSGANPNTVVVNCTGVAVAMPWLDNVKGLVQAWFAGQEAGNAIADVLTGAVNPGGRLPVSFPRAIEDAPAHGNFPGTVIDGQLRVTYEEGVFIGYRHYDRSDSTKLLFPFGYGLSYTTFSQGNVAVTNTDDLEKTFEVTVDVTNTGSIAGAETVQVYAGPAAAAAEHPIKELVGFAKVRLEPGQTKKAAVRFSVRDLAHFSESAGQWIVDKGEYKVYVGQSARDIVDTKVITVEAISYQP